MAKFSERQGIVPAATALQKEGVSGELRNSLWNVLYIFVWSENDYTDRYSSESGRPLIEGFSQALWFAQFKQPLDSMPGTYQGIQEYIRNHFFSCKWYEVYDFIEFVVTHFATKKQVVPAINKVLERELAGYRLIDGQFVAVTDEAEVEALRAALSDERFPGVRLHLKTAVERLSDRKNPDYRNAIKEAISAVESMARVITGDDKAILSDALKVLEKQKKLHPALKDGFVKLYGYTSDEQGVRHAMMDEPNITAADAKFFLLSCTSFVNYLKSLL